VWSGLIRGGEDVVEAASEVSFEAADRFAFALAFGLFGFGVGARRGVIARLRDRDPIERGVQLSVAAAIEPVSLAFP